MALFAILKSNLRSKKGNFISIFIFVFIIALSLTTIISVNQGTLRRLNKAGNQAKVADIVSFTPSDKLTPDMIQGIKKTDGVTEVEIQPSIISSKMTIRGKTTGSMVFMVSYDKKQHPYQIFNAGMTGFLQGTKTEPGVGEVYLPVSLHNMYDCGIGDSMKIETGEGTREYRIAGFVEEPFIGSGVIGVKEIFLNQEDLASLISMEDGKELLDFSIVDIMLDKNRHISNIMKELNTNTGLVSISTYTMTKEEANNYTLIFTNIISGILSAFAILLFIIILIIIGHTVSTAIEMDYTTLGILKSQGFTSFQIRCILLMQYMTAGLAGTIAGIAVSCFTIPYVNCILLPITGLLVGRDMRLLQSMGVMIALLAMIAVYTYLKTRKIMKVSPVQAISSGHAPVFFSNKADFSITKSIPLPLSVKMVLKEIAGNIKRYVSTIVIMAILTFFTLSVTSLSQMTSLDYTNNAFGNISSDIEVYYPKDIDTSIIASVEEEINQQDKILIKFHMDNRYFTVDDISYLGHIIDNTDILQKPLKGRIPEYENEIMMTEIMSKEIGKGIGEMITLKYGSSQVDFMIVGLNQYTSDVGKNFFLLSSGMKRLEADFRSGCTAYQIKDKSKCAGIVKSLKNRFGDQKDKIRFIDANKQSKDSLSNVLTALYAITAITYVFVIIFDIIVSYMICQKLFLREKQNMGIYKSVGFTSKGLRGQFILRFLFVSVIGCGLGLLCNFIWNNDMMSLLLTRMGISHFVTIYSAWNVLIPIICISGFATLFSYLISGKIAAVSPKNLIQE